MSAEIKYANDGRGIVAVIRKHAKSSDKLEDDVEHEYVQATMCAFLETRAVLIVCD